VGVLSCNGHFGLGREGYAWATRGLFLWDLMGQERDFLTIIVRWSSGVLSCFLASLLLSCSLPFLGITLSQFRGWYK